MNKSPLILFIMNRDGITAEEAEEIAEDIRYQVIQGRELANVLPEFGIDPRELGLRASNNDL